LKKRKEWQRKWERSKKHYYLFTASVKYHTSLIDGILILFQSVQEYVRSRHTKYLKESGSLEQLTTVNLDAALEILLDQGDWAQLLKKAKANPTSYSLYLGKYAVHAISEREPLNAIRIYHAEVSST